MQEVGFLIRKAMIFFSFFGIVEQRVYMKLMKHAEGKKMCNIRTVVGDTSHANPRKSNMVSTEVRERVKSYATFIVL